VMCPDGASDNEYAHLECHGTSGVVKVATPGLDFCTAPGAFPSPTGSGFLWCCGGEGTPCGGPTDLPCHTSFLCDSVEHVCTQIGGPAPLPCSRLCDPAGPPGTCAVCSRRETLGASCVWPGTPPP
jgi:hypothetical protein